MTSSSGASNTRVSKRDPKRSTGRLVVLIYLGTLLCTAPAALAFGSLVHHRFFASLSGETFARGDMALLAELIVNDGTALVAVGIAAIATLPLFMLGSIFLQATAVAHILQPRKSGLFEGGGRLFWRFFRLAVLFVPIFIVLFGAAMGGAVKGTDVLTKEWTDGWQVFFVRTLAVFVALLFGTMLAGVHDLMRFALAEDERTGAFRAFGRGLWAALSSPLGFVRVRLPFVVLGMVVIAGLSILDAQADRVGWALMGLGLAVEQGLSFVRAALSVATLRAEARWYFRG